MIKAYKIYKYQAEVLSQMTKADGSKFNPVEDINGEFFISEREHKECGLGKLEEFIPPKEEENI